MQARQIFFHYLFSKRSGALVKIISYLCVLGILIGVAALVVVLSVMNGFNQNYRMKLLAADPHLVVSAEGQRAEVLVRDLKKTEGLQFFSFHTQDVIVRTIDGVFGGAIAKGMDPESIDLLMKRLKHVQQKKREIEIFTGELQPGEILMGRDLATSLGVFEGDQVTVMPPETLLRPPDEAPLLEKVRVRALLTTEVTDVDSKLILFNAQDTLLRFARTASLFKGIEIYLEDPYSFGGLKNKLENAGYKVESWRDRNSSLFFALRVERIAMTTFLGLSALITSFSIVTILILLLTQKRQDLGMMMAMGLSPKKTKWLFVRVGLLLSGLGLGGGLVLGIVLSLAISHFKIKFLPETVYYDAVIPAVLDVFSLFWIGLCAVLVGFVAAWLPTHLYARLSPSEALRSRGSALPGR